VTAALVHGFVSSGSRPETGALAPRAILSLPGAPSTTRHASRQYAPATQKATSGEQVHSFAANGTDSAALAAGKGYGTLVIPRNRLVHADAALQVQVSSHAALSTATNKATQIVASLGGYAQSVQYQSSRGGEGDSFLALRVPVGKAQTAITKLGSLGRLVSQEISTQDLQQQLTRQNNQIGSLQRAIAVYEQALQSGTLTAAERVEIQIRLSNAEHSLKLLRQARSGTVASGATADISLTLTTNRSGILPVHHKSGRFGRLLGSAAGFLGLEGIIVLYALVVLSPVLVLGGLTWWILRERRRREESRLLASA
jgi:hypothetical protein